MKRVQVQTGKGEVDPVHDMDMSGYLHASLPGKELPITSEYDGGRPQSRSRRFLEKNFLPLTGILQSNKYQNYNLELLSVWTLLIVQFLQNTKKETQRFANLIWCHPHVKRWRSPSSVRPMWPSYSRFLGYLCMINKIPAPKYVGRSNLNENLVPSRAQINLYERACADKLWHV
jgi:hypothetical protein